MTRYHSSVLATILAPVLAPVWTLVWKRRIAGVLLAFPSVCLAASSPVSVLKQIHLRDSSNVELVFDKMISRGKVHTDLLNDMIQLSFEDASIYPARMIPVDSPLISKIFAYQYSPKLVRCRIFLKAKATTLRDHIAVDGFRKKFTLQLTPKPGFVHESPSETAPEAADSKADDDNEEKKLLEKVLKGNPGAGDSVQKEGEHNAGGLTQDKHDAKEKNLHVGQGVKALPSFKSLIVKSGMVLLLALIVGVLMLKLKGIKKSKDAGFMSKIKRMVFQGLPSGQKMIQMVATYHLDPKKSIAVVRVAGKLLVLGVAHESINLITQFSDDAEGEDFGSSDSTHSEARSENLNFSEFFGKERFKPASTASTSPQMTPSLPNSGVRDRIKNRLEGLKPL